MVLDIASEIKRLVEVYNLRSKAFYCYQCGTCSGSCPVFSANPEYNPRRMIESLINGTWETYLNSDIVWLCTTCHMCLERCPQKVEVSEILAEVRNIIARRGLVPDIIVEKLERLEKTGASTPYSKLVEKRRKMYKLPPLPELDPGAIKEIFDMFAVDYIIKNKKTRGEENE